MNKKNYKLIVYISIILLILLPIMINLYRSDTLNHIKFDHNSSLKTSNDDTKLNIPLHSEYISSSGGSKIYECVSFSSIIYVSVKWDASFSIDLKLTISGSFSGMDSSYSTGDFQESLEYDFSSYNPNSPLHTNDYAGFFSVKVENMGNSDGYYDLIIADNSFSVSIFTNPEILISISLSVIIPVIFIIIFAVVLYFTRSNKNKTLAEDKPLIKLSDDKKKRVENFCHFCGEKVLNLSSVCNYCGTDTRLL